MSHHHILPPIVYTPAPPKPKETRRKRRVGYTEGTDEVDETGETAETGEVSQTPAFHSAASLPQNQTPIEATERRLHPTTGNLSDDTLKTLLELQEQQGPQGPGSSSGAKESS